MRRGCTLAAIAFLLTLAGLAVFRYRGGWSFDSPWLPWPREFAAGRLNQVMAGQRILDTSVGIRVVSYAVEPHDTTGKAALPIELSADLEVAVEDRSRNRFTFLLNPGLSLTAATVDARPARWSRDGHVITINSPRAVSPGQHALVHIEYGGFLGASPFLQGDVSPEGMLLPMLSLWFPLDLRSFFTFRCEATMPESWTPVLDDQLATATTEDGLRRVTWAERRPVLGASLAAGPYQKRVRTHGAVRCTLFWPEGEIDDPYEIINTMGSVYSYLRTQYASDGFDAACAVLDPRILEPSNGGNSVLFLPSELPSNTRQRFALVARQIAHNWWGYTITGRWLTDKPEAASWVVDGFAEYSAWLALRNLEGRESYLRYLEQLRCPPRIEFPMKTLSLLDRFRPPRHGAETDPTYRDVRQPYTLSVFAARTGHDNFRNACANMLKIYRYGSISCSAALQEMELASEADLKELFRLWFERPGSFDYAISDVAEEENAIRVTITNGGDIPAMVDLVLALVTKSGVETKSIDVGAHGGSYLFPVTSPVSAVILDPEFTMPDMIRANNVWPRVRWPRRISVSSAGRLALVAGSEWTAPQPDHLAVVALGEASMDRIEIEEGIAWGPLWSHDRQKLLLKAGNTYSWEPDRGLGELGGAEFIPAGWVGAEALLVDDRGSTWYRGAPGQSPRKLAPCTIPPVPLSLRARQDERMLAYLAEPDGTLQIRGYPALGALEVTPKSRPAGDMAWTGDGQAIVFVNRNGAIEKLPIGMHVAETVLQLGYRVQQSAVADDGRAVSWLDPNSELRYCLLASPLPRRAQLPGEPVSFVWEADKGLVVLVAEPVPSLPMLCYARYSLWRIPIDGKPSQRLPFDLGRGL